MRVNVTHATYVPKLNEGISKNVHHFRLAVREHGVDARLCTPEVDVAELNRKTMYARKALEATRCLRQGLRDPDVDLLHYHVSIPSFGLLARLAKVGAPDKPIVAELWNPHFAFKEAYGPRSPVDVAYHATFNGPFLARRGFKAFDAVVVSSRFQEQQLVRQGWDGPIHVVPNGADLDRYRPPTPAERDAARAAYGLSPDDEVVLYFGHLTPWKGVHVLAKAFRAVVEERPRARLLIARTGYGNGEDAVRAALGPALERAVFVGNTDVAKLMHAGDVGVLPLVSTVGTAVHPNVLLEMLAAGLPVVASAVGSVPEVVTHGRTGRLFPPADDRALADELRRLLADADERRALGTNARAWAEAHARWSELGRQMKQVYQSAAS